MFSTIELKQPDNHMEKQVELELNQGLSASLPFPLLILSSHPCLALPLLALSGHSLREMQADLDKEWLHPTVCQEG
jgi:hypothetical protein